MHPLTATCIFLVAHPMAFPVAAAVGQLVSVWSLAENLWVVDPRTGRVVRTASFPEGKLWTALADLLEAGTLTALSPSDAWYVRQAHGGPRLQLWRADRRA